MGLQNIPTYIENAINVPIVISLFITILYPNPKTTIVPTPHDNSTNGQKKSFNITAFIKESFNSFTIPLKLFLVPSSFANPCTTFIPEKSS